MEKRLSVGLFAHVDAGKTTLSEAMLYAAGAIRRKGRVDHGDTFLDTNAMERRRGITIFSKPAIFSYGGVEVTLVDTPGHVDFAAEAERVMAILDVAILLVSASDGVQSHTRTLFELLRRNHVPTFVFLNKTDLIGADPARSLAMLQKLDPGFLPAEEPLGEEAATLDEAALEEYLETGSVSRETERRLIAEAKLFPVYRGSALRGEGVLELVSGLVSRFPPPARGEENGAIVYKISRDAQGTRLTWLKVTGGALRVKESLGGGEKLDQLRLYSGEKFRLLDCAEAGTVLAVTGLSDTYAGQTLGRAPESLPPRLEPVLSYQVELPEGTEPHVALAAFRRLEEEEPLLRVEWNERLGELSVRLMGEVQLEVLKALCQERFGLAVRFGEGGVVYRETIRTTVEGVGHFEPLRHYAEVHLILSPTPRGSGLSYATVVSEDSLDRNWQRLILTHLMEKTHLGVLTGSPITDLRLTLAAGRAHLKHTEGGDFREATYRAVRQGLMQAKSLLLEPWYAFRLELPADCLGRAMTDLGRMSAKTEPPEITAEGSVLTGTAPVVELAGYAKTLAAYSRGLGRLTTTLSGYEPCHNEQEVIERMGYSPERDTDNTPDSVFCAHGAGFTVKWDEVPRFMHLESALAPLREPEKAQPVVRRGDPVAAGEEELRSIFERTYGAIKPREREEERKKPARRELAEGKREIKSRFVGPDFLLVDGYNIIFAWPELQRIAAQNVDAARKQLADTMVNLHGLRGHEVILVFDAWKVKGGVGSVQTYSGISIVYTREAETADSYIEKTAHKLSKEHRVYVATSDGPEQMIILGSGALRVTAQELRQEVEAGAREIRAVAQSETAPRNRALGEAYQRALEEQHVKSVQR
ncbi:MAG: NYN domain-containing protein [bacterium]